MIDVVWKRLEGLLPSSKRTGRPYVHDRRMILEAIVYMMETGDGWRALPAGYPPWQTVHWQLCQWKESGVWDKIWSGLPEPGTGNQLQL